MYADQPTYNKSKHDTLPSITNTLGSTPFPIYSDSIIYANDANKAIIVTAPPTNTALKVGFVIIDAEVVDAVGAAPTAPPGATPGDIAEDRGDEAGASAPTLLLNCPRMTPGSTGLGYVRRETWRQTLTSIS